MDGLGEGFWQWISQYGGWGAAMVIAGFGFWLVLTGRLIPKSWADKIFDTNSKQSEALKTSSEVLPQILEYMRTNNRLLTELQKLRDQQGGGSQ